MMSRDRRFYSTLQRFKFGRMLAITLLIVATGAKASYGQTVPPVLWAATYDFTPVTALMQQSLTQYKLNGASLRVVAHTQQVYAEPFGTYSLDTVVPIASTTKSMSAAIIMALVDAGKLRLEDKASTYIASFTTADKKTITLRQLLTHSSGLPGQDTGCLSDMTTTLAACVDQIAQVPLQYASGTAFAYGGNSFQVAGRMAEIASGQTWAQPVAETLTTPLGLTTFNYGTTQNPRIAGGASAGSADIGRFAQMLRDNGTYQGMQVLSSGAVTQMTTNQVAGLPVLNSPAPADTYGLGLWLKKDAQGNYTTFYGAGAFGTEFWIDTTRNTAAVFLVQNQYVALRPLIGQLQQAVATVIDAGQPLVPEQRLFLPLMRQEQGVRR